MQQNLAKHENFKLKLLEIKKVGWPILVLRGSLSQVNPTQYTSFITWLSAN